MAIGIARGLDLGQNLVLAAEGGIDHLVAGRFLIGREGVFAQCFGDGTAPAFEIQLGAHGARLPCHGGHDPAGQPGCDAGRTEKAKERPAVDIAVAHSFAQALIARRVVNFLGHG